MTSKNNYLNQRQLVYQEIFVGTLIYAVVLGFFDDYTSIVYAKSFTTIFLASIALEILTYLAIQLKGSVIRWLKRHEGKLYRGLTFFGVWLIMFLSKFVFIWVLDLLFGEYISVNGFFGILLVVLCVTIIHRLAFYVFQRLGEN